MPDKKNPRKIAVTMNKGGCSKTTTAVHLAAGLAQEGKSVLLIDSDPQSKEGNVAKHLGITLEQLPKSLKDFVLEGDKEAIIEARENLFFIRGGYEVNGLRRDLDRRQLGGELAFSEAFTPIQHLFDYIILDTPPSWDAININGLFYCDEIIIPISLEGATVSTIRDYLTVNLNEIQRYRKIPLKWGYALPTRYHRGQLQSKELLDQISLFFDTTLMTNPEFAEYSNTALCAPISINVRLSEAFGHGQTVFEYDPTSTGAKDYLEFTRSVMSHG